VVAPVTSHEVFGVVVVPRCTMYRVALVDAVHVTRTLSMYVPSEAETVGGVIARTPVSV